MTELYDCIIVGGGPAGLNAALILGRCLRRVLLCDNGQPRNARSQALHGFLTRDGMPPLDLLQTGRDQLRPYETVTIEHTTVVRISCAGTSFEAALSDGRVIVARKVLLATGVTDKLPDVEGLQEMYGRSVFHCPYCDGFEHRGQPLAVYGDGKSGVGLALTLSIWSKDIVLCSDGPCDCSRLKSRQMKDRGISVRTDKISRLEGDDGMLERVVFRSGDSLPRKAMFVHTEQRQHSDLAERLGCNITVKRSVTTGRYEITNVPGLYVAGDASRDVQLVIVAAAEGAMAAFAINTALLKEDLGRPAPADEGMPKADESPADEE